MNSQRQIATCFYADILSLVDDATGHSSLSLPVSGLPLSEPLRFQKIVQCLPLQTSGSMVLVSFLTTNNFHKYLGNILVIQNLFYLC